VREILGRALTESRAETDSTATDPRLWGRTYAIPFDRVWSSVLEIANSNRGWTVVHSDDLAGVLRCEAESLFFRRVSDVFVRVSLDENAQTRVDVISRSREKKGDLGASVRRIGRFIKQLDRRLKATPGQILDPTIPLSWSMEGVEASEPANLIDPDSPTGRNG
jgi:uncharacterized protein (DUF1499 family)